MFSVLVTPLTQDGEGFQLDIVAPWWESWSRDSDREMWTHLTGELLNYQHETGPQVRAFIH